MRTGRDEILRQWKYDVLIFGLQDMKLNTKTIGLSDSIIYETGTGHSTVRSKAQTGTDTSFVFKFKYTNIWKKQADGRYKLIIDNYNQLTYDGWLPEQ